MSKPGVKASKVPIISALIRALPDEYKTFTAEQRADWLRMMEMAFGMVYGPADREAPAPKPKPPVSHDSTLYPLTKLPEPRCFIDCDGFAYRAHGERKFELDPQEMPTGEILWDERKPNEAMILDTIIWRSGVMPQSHLTRDGIKLNIQPVQR